MFEWARATLLIRKRGDQFAFSVPKVMGDSSWCHVQPLGQLSTRNSTWPIEIPGEVRHFECRSLPLSQLIVQVRKDITQTRALAFDFGLCNDLDVRIRFLNYVFDLSDVGVLWHVDSESKLPVLESPTCNPAVVFGEFGCKRQVTLLDFDASPRFFFVGYTVLSVGIEFLDDVNENRRIEPIESVVCDAPVVGQRNELLDRDGERLVTGSFGEDLGKPSRPERDFLDAVFQ